MITLAQQRGRRRHIIGVTLGIARRGGYEAMQMRAVAEHADLAAGTAETVGQLLADFDDGKLAGDIAAPEGLSTLLAQRGLAPLTWRHWQNIDAEERRRGAEAGRPRMKFVDIAEMLTAAL
jgi:hypothetical protein